MESFGEQLKTKSFGTLVNKLPAEIVGRFLQNISIGDRLKSERVSPRWKRTLSKWGWTEQRKLTARTVFEGAHDRNVTQFLDSTTLDKGSCSMVSLFHYVGQNLIKLDLGSFEFVRENLEPFVSKIAESIQLLPRLEVLNIESFDLQDFVEFLPWTLRELQLTISGRISVEMLEALSHCCPNLVEVPFQDVEIGNSEKLTEFLGKFPRQKRLSLSDFSLPSAKIGALASVGQLKELVELDLCHDVELDEKSFEAILVGCLRLRVLQIDIDKLTEEALFHLTKIQNLTVLAVNDQSGSFSDSVLKAVARKGQLRKFKIFALLTDDDRPIRLTDDSIVFLVDRCKSLFSLSLSYCSRITERSLEAVVAELQRRYGSPPRTLPIHPLAEGVFHFSSCVTGIDKETARELVGDNPWLVLI